MDLPAPLVRSFFWLHRWTGIYVGIMALVWFASGIVVHWYASPEPTDAEAVRAYGPPLEARELADKAPPPGIGGQPYRSATIRHRGKRLIWQVRLADGRTGIIDARTDRALGPIDSGEARLVAAPVAGRDPADGLVQLVTHYNELYFHQSYPLPVYRVVFQAPRAVDIYIDPATASVVAIVGPRQRVTRMFGGIPHFLDVGPLHTHRTAWLVILMTLVTAVLISGLTGLVYGIWLLLKQVRDRHTLVPRAWTLSVLLSTGHHWLGIAVGGFVVTWTLSGVLMVWYPQVDPVADEVARWEGGGVNRDEFAVSLERALAEGRRGGHALVFALTAKHVVGKPVYEALYGDGNASLIDAVSGRNLSPLTDSLVRAVVRRYLGANPHIARVDFLDHYDPYYFQLHERYRPLPVFRVAVNNPDISSPLYIDAERGDLVGRVSGSYRTFRWFGSAIHTFDFPALLFNPPVWDSVVVGLALLGALLSGSGLWLGARYLVRASRR